jgi:hypothetical protein
LQAQSQPNDLPLFVEQVMINDERFVNLGASGASTDRALRGSALPRSGPNLKPVGFETVACCATPPIPCARTVPAPSGLHPSQAVSGW